MTDPTTFNGKSVPPFKELTPSNWEEETKKNKFWMVKHYRYVELGQGVIHMLIRCQSVL